MYCPSIDPPRVPRADHRRLPRPRARIVVIVGALLAVTGRAGAAAPPTPPTARECAAASAEAASLRKDEKLATAKERLLLCADASCPADVRTDCARRLLEVGDATPTVVFEVRDAAGNDVGAVRVSMDGALLIERLGGSLLTLDPGEHTFRFEGPSASQVVEKSFVIRDGEKNRRIPITFPPASPVVTPVAVAPAAIALAPAPGAPGPRSSSLGGRKIGAIVTGGAGVAALGVGTTFGILALASWNNAKTECSAGCTASSLAQTTKSTASSQATLSTVAFVAGGVLLAGAAVLWFTAPAAEHVQLGASASADGAGLLVRGTF